MPDDIDKINDIFREQDRQAKKNATGSLDGLDPNLLWQELSADSGDARGKSTPLKAVDQLFIDKTGQQEHNYTGDEASERDYRPVRQSHEYRSGCLGGLMYFVFIACVSIVFACMAWMAASDMLALNKDDFTAVVPA